MVTAKHLSKQVYEQIAQNLVKEQAEAMKHQTLVDEYQKILVEGKKQIIRNLIMGKRLFFDRKRLLVLDVNFGEKDNKLSVVVIVGLNPANEIIPGSLTKKETQLLNEYKNLYRYCSSKDEDLLAYVQNVINELSSLKNKLDLVRYYYWTIDLNNTTQPGFFSRSGLNSGLYGNSSCEELMIEEVTKIDLNR